MDDESLMYKAIPKNQEWEQYKAKPLKKQPEPEMDEQSHLDTLKKQHPLMYKLAEYLQGSPALEKAGNIAGHFNNAVEGTGLPSLAKGFFGTGIDMGRGVANLVPGVNVPKQEYKDLNVNPYVGEGAETIGSLGMGLPVYRGYQGVKKGIEAIPYAKKIPELVRNLLAGGATGAVISPDHRGMGAALGAGAELVPAALKGGKNYISNRNRAGKEKELYKAMMEHEMQKAEHESLKNLATHQFGKNNPEALLLGAEDKAKELASAEAFKKNRIGEEKALPGQQLIPEAEHGVKNVNDVLKQTLGEGEPHSQQLSKHIVDAIEGEQVVRPHPKTGLPRKVREGGEREAWGHKMDELENALPEVEIPGSTDIKAVEKELQKLVGEKSGLSEKEKDKFRDILTKTHPSSASTTTNGRKFFRAYRSLRTLEGKERSKAFGLDPSGHDEWIDRANQTKQTYENMEKIIEKHFPEDTLKRLYELNHEYSNNIAPLHENPMYQQMLNHGKYKGSVIEALSGTTPGNDILNNMITKSPELARLTLGHSFAKKPEELLKPNKLLEPYVGANSEIQKLLGFQKQAQGELEAAKKTAEAYKHIEKIPQLTKEIAEQRAITKRLKQESEVRGITKEEVAKKKIEYEKAQKKFRTTINRLITSSVVAGSLGYAAKKVRE